MKYSPSFALPLVMGFAAFSLLACGDDVTEKITEQVYTTVDNVGAVDTKDSLPECNKEKAGQTAYVMDDNAFFGCDGEKWRQLNNSTVSFGDNVCSSIALPDDEGFKIVCNGDSIGVVRNGIDGEKGDPGENGKDGVDGKDGEDGKDGVGKNGVDGKDGAACKIKESTALTALPSPAAPKPSPWILRATSPRVMMRNVIRRRILTAQKTWVKSRLQVRARRGLS